MAGADFDVFISYSRRDLPDVEAIAPPLREAGLRVAIDVYELPVGLPWPQQLESVIYRSRSCVVIIGSGERSPWQQREIYLALDRQVHDPSFRVIPLLLPGADPALGFLGLNTWIDLRDGICDATRIAMLVRAIAQTDQEYADGPVLRSVTCPYRGLLQFREEDAPFFCGRESTTDLLELAINRKNFVALLGSSGSGKSSILRAGLLPRLRRDGQHRWEALIITPTDKPFHALTASLYQLLSPSSDPLVRQTLANSAADGLINGDLRLESLLSGLFSGRSAVQKLLLIVDQWEEVVTLAVDAKLATQFIEMLIDATSEHGHCRSVHFAVLIAIRGDFVASSFLSNRNLADRLQQAIVNIGPMTSTEIHDAMVKPASQVGILFEEGLVNRILDAVEHAPSHLPLLEFLLQQLWLRREASLVKHAAFEEAGGLRGAVARHADALMESLPQPDRTATRQLFMRIVRVVEGSEPASRRTPLLELTREEQRLAHWFANERLVVISRSLDGSGDTIEIAHEALIDSWTTLRQWCQEDRAFMLWREKLWALATSWKSSGRGPTARDEDALLRGALLDQSLQWRKERRSSLSRDDLEFIDASARHQKTLYDVALQQQRKELERERSLLSAEKIRLQQALQVRETRRRLLFTIAALAIAVTVGVIALLGMIRQVQRARDQFALTERAELQASRLTEAYPAVDSAQLIINLCRAALVSPPSAKIKVEDQRLIETLMEDYDRTFGALSISAADLKVRVRRVLSEGDALLAQGNAEVALKIYNHAVQVSEKAEREAPDFVTLQEVIESHLKVGDALAKTGATGNATTEFQTASRLFAELAGRRDLDESLRILQKSIDDRLKKFP